MIVDRLRELILAVCCQRLGTTEQTFAKGKLSTARCIRERIIQSFRGGGGTDVAKRTCGGLCGVGLRKQFGESTNGLGIASRAKAADYAQPRAALDVAEGISQGFVDRGVADPFQCIACHVRELLVAQHAG